MKRTLSRTKTIGLGAALVLSFVLLPIPSMAQAPIVMVAPSQPRFNPREPITVNFSDGLGNAKDWIGVYLPGEVPGSGTPAIMWYYVDGTKDGLTGINEGSITFPFGLSQPGTYALKFLENDSYAVIASASFTIAIAPRVQAEHDTYYTEEPISISFFNGPGNKKDWVGLYPDGEIPGTGPLATAWNYVDNSRDGNTGFNEGTITISDGLASAGDWDLFFLENDGYKILASNTVRVADLFTPLIRADKRQYAKGTPISITFTNGPGSAKDWIGLYRVDETPGSGTTSSAYLYVDGTQGGNTSLTDGMVTFSSGLPHAGDYIAYFLADDGYDILASESFSILNGDSLPVRVVSTTPSDNATNVAPLLSYSAVVANGTTEVNTNSFKLTLDAVAIPFQVRVEDQKYIISASPDMLPLPGSEHDFELTFADSASPANELTNKVHFTVGYYRNIVLPKPLYFDSFDTIPEGQLPAGWTEQNFTEIQNFDIDFANLDSAAYATWTSVDAERFKGPFITYSNPDDTRYADDYHRVLTPNLFNVLNGKVFTNALATGHFLFSDSGYRNGSAQIAYLFTRDYDLSGKTNVYLSFHSLWEQNQDSSASIEYSVDQGQTWNPIVYMIEQSDVVMSTNENGIVSIDAVSTFTQDHGDVAHYIDPETGEDRGGNYGAFIAAPVSEALAPYISARVEDNSADSKRIELFRLPLADNQAKVRFRFAQNGTDSWYFGIDDFGIYSLSEQAGPAPELNVRKDAGGLTIQWDAAAGGYILEASSTLPASTWTEVEGVNNNSVMVPFSEGTRFFRLRHP